MARRFGRNQRRQMREQIATAQRAHAYATDRYREAEKTANQLRDRLERWAEEIRHIMGDDSAFNEQLRVIRMRRENMHDTLRLSPIRALPGLSSKEPPVYDTVGDIINVAIFRCMTGDLGRHIELKIVGPDGALVGYGLSKDLERRWSPRTIRYVADMIALEMARHLLVSS